jgi:hypothetical protein
MRHTAVANGFTGKTDDYGSRQDQNREEASFAEVQARERADQLSKDIADHETAITRLTETRTNIDDELYERREFVKRASVAIEALIGISAVTGRDGPH